MLTACMLTGDLTDKEVNARHSAPRSVAAQAARDCYAIRDIGPHRIAFLSCTRYNYCNLVRVCTVTFAAKN